MKPSDGYRLNQGYVVGTVIGALCALPFTFTSNAEWFYVTFPLIGGPIGWIVAFLQMGGDLN